MAGALWRIELSDTEAREFFTRLVRDGADLRPLLDEIGSELEDSTRKRFGTETAPDGTAWVDITDHWKARKEEKGLNLGILKASGDLANSIRWESEVGHVDIVAGPVEYAAIHQYGGEAGRGHAVDIPARPYLGLSASDEAEIADALSDYLGRLIHGG